MLEVAEHEPLVVGGQYKIVARTNSARTQPKQRMGSMATDCGGGRVVEADLLV